MNDTTSRGVVRTIGALAVVTGTLAGAACIQKETRSVMYLEPTGAVTWSITESDVRSDVDAPADRAKEEEGYRVKMLSNPAPLVARLDSMGGRSISRSILKDEAPFEVNTVAKFDRIDRVFDALCAAGGYLCVSRLSTEGDRTTFTVEVIGEVETAGHDSDSPIDLLSDLKIVCVEGRFVEAIGFKLTDPRTATIADTDGPDDHVVLTLTWQKQG